MFAASSTSGIRAAHEAYQNVAAHTALLADASVRAFEILLAMKILHTADWHAGKRLGRYDRSRDTAAALDAIVDIADREAVDLVVVAGDLFDRPQPPIDALRLVLATLRRLSGADKGPPTRPVVAIAGNHDSPDLFDVLAPLVAADGIHLVGTPKAPEDGGILRLEVGSDTAFVACIPFVREGRVVDFLDAPGAWRGAYATRMRELCQAYDQALLARCSALRSSAPADTSIVALVTAHFMVEGVLLPGGPRGERALHTSDAYAAPPDSFGTGAAYVALGHIHLPQALPASRVPARYAGSPIPLDFGEAGEDKGIVIVDVDEAGGAEARTVAIRAGRPLLRARGRFEALALRDDLAETFLDLTIETDGPDPGLATRAREAFPFLVKVRAAYPRTERRTPERRGRAWTELYADYVRAEHELEPDPDLLDAFRAILDDVDAAA